MTDNTRPGPTPSKPLTLQDWETLIDDFHHGGARRHRWSSSHSLLLDAALSSLNRRDFPLKLPLIVFLEEFSSVFFSSSDASDSLPHNLHRLIESLRALLQTPPDGLHVSLALKEQTMISVTAIVINSDYMLDSLVELLLAVVNRPNHAVDRHARAIACECLRELEKAYPCLLSDVAGHLWSLCQSERTHAAQSYLLLFAAVVRNIVTKRLSVSILSTTTPLVPFTAPSVLVGAGGAPGIEGLNLKELRRAMSFLLEWTQVLTPCAMAEFLDSIMPVVAALELPSSMLKVQFFGMVYSADPLLCHVVLMMYGPFLDAFDGQEARIARRLMMLSTETQQPLVFRLLGLHWLLAFGEVVLRQDVWKVKGVVDLGLRFYPSVFDPLALKALKLDVLAFCGVCVDRMRSEGVEGDEELVVKVFRDGLVSVSAFKWLPPHSTETAVAFRTLHRFLIGSSSHLDSDPSTTRCLMDSTTFTSIQGMLVDLMLEYRKLVPVIVALTGRLFGCQKHRWLGERLLQSFDQHLLPKVKLDYTLVSCFPVLDKIAESDTIPPRGLLELLTKFMAFLVVKHGPFTGLRSWSQGSRVLGICRTFLMHHHTSRLFLRLSRLFAFTCLYFPDLEVRDNARIYLRLLICVPGKRLRDMLNLGEELGISPSALPSFNVQSPLSADNINKSKGISSYIHLERVIPLLVQQSWSLSLSSFVFGNHETGYPGGIRDSEPIIEESEIDSTDNIQVTPETERIDLTQEPLRVMDAKISEILVTLRRHFSCIPDYRHMPGFKVRISCTLRFESETLSRIWGFDSPADVVDELEAFPALFATVLKFSSSAPFGSIASYHIPFLLGEPPRKQHIPDQAASLAIVPVENGLQEEDSFKAPVMIELEPREPTPGLIDVSIETNAENGHIIRGQLHSITVGIEDMFLRAVIPSDIPEVAAPGYYLDLFYALWEACGNSSTGRETFPLKGGKGVAAIAGTRSVKLLEIPASSVIQATERHLAPFVVSVTGEPLVNAVKDGGIIRDVIWRDDAFDVPLDITVSGSDLDRGPLHLTYTDDVDGRDSSINTPKKNMGCLQILIFLPPRFHLLFEMEVCDSSTLVRMRTDHWPCLAYTDDYLEALFLA